MGKEKASAEFRYHPEERAGITIWLHWGRYGIDSTRTIPTERWAEIAKLTHRDVEAAALELLTVLGSTTLATALPSSADTPATSRSCSPAEPSRWMAPGLPPGTGCALARLPHSDFMSSWPWRIPATSRSPCCSSGATARCPRIGTRAASRPDATGCMRRPPWLRLECGTHASGDRPVQRSKGRFPDSLDDSWLPPDVDAANFSSPHPRRTGHPWSSSPSRTRASRTRR